MHVSLVDYSPTTNQNKASSISRSWTSHSQMVKVLHPKASRDAFAFSSRAMFAANFEFQNSTLVAGIAANLQPWCRCQKQP